MPRRPILALLLGLWLLGSPASADPGEFFAAVDLLVKQYLKVGVPVEAREDSCWLESDAMIRGLAIASFLADERLRSISVEEHLDPIRQTLKGPLAELDPLVAVDMVAGAEYDAGRFSKALRKLRWRTLPNWRNPETKQAVTRLVTTLSELREREVQLSLSARYRKKWTFDVSAVWFPYTRRISLYTIGSSECLIAGRTKSATLRLKGIVHARPGPAGERVFTVELDGKPEFACRGCEIEVTGRWSDRRQPSDGSKVSLSNNLDLSVRGAHATGRLTQDVVITNSQGLVTSGRITYRLEGRINPEGELDGTFEAVGDRKAMWLESASDKLRGTWSGTIDAVSGKAMGTVTLKGKGSFPWEGLVKR
ncbi:MAG: hypothetical protein HY319_25175 [Armatimonadetes bacterium]|nr:hypothetical protein [Armatimonadota bacterium]